MEDNDLASESASHARNELDLAVARMIELLDATPDERLSWKPAPHARSIVEIAAHTAHALRNILSQMKGTPFDLATSAEANAAFLAHDKEFTDREKVKAYLNESRHEYGQFLAGLTEDDLDRLEALPFGLGLAPIRYFTMAGANHTSGHNAQIEYVQTLYGDTDWHTGF